MSDDDFAPLPCPDCGSAGSCHCYAKRLGEKLESAEANVKALRTRVAELERERDALAKRVSDLEYHLDSHVRATDKAQADAARLREVLAQVRDAMLATGQGPDGDDDPRRPLAAAVWRALASAPWDGLGPDFVEATL